MAETSSSEYQDTHGLTASALFRQPGCVTLCVPLCDDKPVEVLIRSLGMSWDQSDATTGGNKLGDEVRKIHDQNYQLGMAIEKHTRHKRIFIIISHLILADY